LVVPGLTEKETRINADGVQRTTLGLYENRSI